MTARPQRPPERPVPPLPPRLVDARPPLVVGIGLWFLAFCVLLVARLVFATGPADWLWTCLAGWVLGLAGLGVVAWQRAAGRRGSRTAQRTH